MKHQTATLEGALLDAAVLKALGGLEPWFQSAAGENYAVNHRGFVVERGKFEPSTRWAHAGPIIERERIMIWPGWMACVSPYVDYEHDVRNANDESSPLRGPTALIAAMRAFVASKLGPEVEL
jgi:hypothetical protein